MATTFPLSTWSLRDETGFNDDLGVDREVMNDGSPQVRVLAGTYRTVRCVFNPLSSSENEALMDYLNANKATEFDFVLGTRTFRGYVWSDVRTAASDGVWYKPSFDFRGREV